MNRVSLPNHLRQQTESIIITQHQLPRQYQTHYQSPIARRGRPLIGCRLVAMIADEAQLLFATNRREHYRLRRLCTGPCPDPRPGTGREFAEQGTDSWQ